MTFVGAYSNVMYITGTLPVTLPKICMGIVYREERDSLEPVTIRAFMPSDDGEEKLLLEVAYQPQAEMIPPPSDEFTFREGRFLVEVPNFTVSEQGKILVRAYCGEDEIRLGRLDIVLNPPTEEQPASTPVQPPE